MSYYQPGLHLICDAQTADTDSLYTYAATQFALNDLVKRFKLTKIGEVYHDFPNGGFTGVVCLTESHISVHTWPEFGRITFDVFLSNYQHINDQTCQYIFDELLQLYNATAVAKHELRR
jgi:S-adenosylmethionine decarboxylase